MNFMFQKNEEDVEINEYQNIINQLVNYYNYKNYYNQNNLNEIISFFNKNKEKISNKFKSYYDSINRLKNNLSNKESLENERVLEIKAKNNEIKKLKLKENELENEIKYLKENMKKYELNENKNKKLKKNEKEIESLKNERNELLENFKTKEKENSDLSNIIKTLKEENDSQKEKLKIIEKEKKSFMKSKEKENQELINKLKSLEKSIEKSEANLISKNKEINLLNSDKQKLTKEFKEKNEKFNNIIKEKSDKILELTNNISSIKNDNNSKLESIGIKLKQKEDENQELKKQNDSLLIGETTKKEFLNFQPLNFYDVIIEIDSINKLVKSGWKINYNEKRKESYEKIIKEETLKIGVLGLNNVGKSYILGLLVNQNVPSGYSVETKGISIKYIDEKKLCLLDSAGIDTPLVNEELNDGEDSKLYEENNNKNIVDQNISVMEKLLEISKDKSQTERFIEELVISLSDMLILVVGKLTRREQNYITRIKNIANGKENNQFKSIVIIHNLSHFCEESEIDNHINTILKNSATFKLNKKDVLGIDEYSGRIFYTENDGTDHLIMARENSNAAKKYNDLTVKLIKRKFNECKNRKKIDIPQKIIDLFSNMSKDIIEDDIEINNLHISDDKKVITLSNEDNQNSKKKELKCQKTYIDEMGQYNSISNKFIPKHSSYAYKEKGNYILLLVIEIPGKIENLTASYLKYGKKKTIQIKGNKLKEVILESKKKNFFQIQDNRNYEEIRYLLPLIEEIELIKETPIEKTQIFEFEFNRNNIEKNEDSLNNKDTDDDDDEDEDENENSKKDSNNIKEEKIKIASGIYAMKFNLTETSWKNLCQKYKKK